ncbi:MAG: nucleotide disphospho-sugar-binding domain-containing protein [Luteolibacter sp.]|uniref:glycosyltransferase n=1 Tax=Luteolibacter sp. TaxID=1962973 RepID=UPI0032665B74
MMRVLIYTIGSSGDVHPFVQLGLALQERGHEIFFITSGHFKWLIDKTGFGFRELGTEERFQEVQDDPNLWHPVKALPTVMKHAVAPSYEPILAYARELNLPGKTGMLCSSLAFGGRNVRDLLGIPMVSVHLAPSLFPSSYRQPVLHGMLIGQRAPKFLKTLQWKIAAKVMDAMICPELNRFRSGLGLPPLRNMIFDGWHSPDRVIALFPEWFAAQQPDWPQQTRLTGFPLFDEKGMREVPAELEEFLSAGEAPVVFTPGSAMKHGHAFFDEAVKALKLMGRRGILLTPFLETIPANLPPEIRHFSYVPFSQVLPRAAALVYHGGIGTCAQTLQAGIPHLIQPMAHDQLDTLSRVKDLGVGDGIHPKHFKAKRIAEVLGALLGNQEVRKRAKEMATRFTDTDWMKNTCELIEETLPAVIKS